MATATETYTPRLKDLYEGEIRERLKDELGLDSSLEHATDGDVYQV